MNQVIRDNPLQDAQDTAAATAASLASSSAVSWAAILAGAAATAAFSLSLLLLGSGLGFAAVSPWVSAGISATTFGISAILWITMTQLVSAWLGGYLAGRLRTKWVGAHTDEVHFRDTAHGFLAWAIAVLIHAALLTSVIASVVGGGVLVGASVAGGVATGAAAGTTSVRGSGGTEDPSAGPLAYFVDSLFRTGMGAASAPPRANGRLAGAQSTDAASTAEVSRVFRFSGRQESLPADDVRYLGEVVAERTGLTQMEAQARVTETYGRLQANIGEVETAAKSAADKARKASSYAALWLFISLLSGAFVASLSATYGGRCRDR
ncbi:MAG: hypothetical protein JJE39_05815 [Vicinamibacteria bacterium]|nr:hypothetical protein [Vicinamibacteria bacterium]